MKLLPVHTLCGCFFYCSLIIYGAFPFVTNGAPLKKCFKLLDGKDTACVVWVVFSNKPENFIKSSLSPHCLNRRAKAGFIFSPASEAPVSAKYISSVEKMGGSCRNIFKWANAASFKISSLKLKSLAALPFVKEIIPLRTSSRRMVVTPKRTLFKKSVAADSSQGFYGNAFAQLSMVAVPAEHSHIKAKLGKAPGSGVVIGLFDSGFRLSHRCFDYVKNNHAIVADSDFVEHDGIVSDADSILKVYHAFNSSPSEEHGSWTLSLIAGYDSGSFAGVAYGAQFVLAKTEWADKIIIKADSLGIDTSIVQIEMHSEEDNWAAALVWAESLGVDIVSSSLGYSNGFTDSMGNARSQDDYTYLDFNGTTTIISKAAQEAVKRGMIIVNAIGNEGDAPGTLDAPADVEDVISVGGVYPDKIVADFSSRGPTSDGRKKPDLVAQATDIYMPDIYSKDSASYWYGPPGTSFSTPVVAGICALIRQTHPTDSAAGIRRRLYASCVFAPEQTAIDNSYGRGIPNALVACESNSSTLPAANDFDLYPNVLDLFHKKNQRIMIRFVGAADDPINYSQTLNFAVRTLSGRLVWSHSTTIPENKQVLLAWPDSPKTYAPGMYYFVVSYRGKNFSKKFLILG